MLRFGILAALALLLLLTSSSNSHDWNLVSRMRSLLKVNVNFPTRMRRQSPTACLGDLTKLQDYSTCLAYLNGDPSMVVNFCNPEKCYKPVLSIYSDMVKDCAGTAGGTAPTQTSLNFLRYSCMKNADSKLCIAVVSDLIQDEQTNQAVANCFAQASGSGTPGCTDDCRTVLNLFNQAGCCEHMFEFFLKESDQLQSARYLQMLWPACDMTQPPNCTAVP